VLSALFMAVAIPACRETVSPLTEPAVRTAAPVTTSNSPLSTATSVPTPTRIPETVSPSIIPTLPQELPINPLTGSKIYQNDFFRLSFQFPSTWYGPDEHVWETQGIRIEVGTDRVYPYGTDRLERTYDVKNSYYVSIQYSRNTNKWTLEQYAQPPRPLPPSIDPNWLVTYFSLLDMKDGESLSDAKGLVIRVRKLKLGKFEGIEYISTLSATAQTEMYYTRQAVLFDKGLNILNITASPNNVDIVDQANWQAAYRKVDEANLDIFYKVLESIVVD
jgi:hypothetical protein